MLTKFKAGIIVLCVIIFVGSNAQAADMEMPFGMSTNHLNLVLSVSDEAKVHEFYGEVLGLKRIPNIPFPGNMHMVRYMGGSTEIKFIVTNQDLPTEQGGVRNARGIRLMAIFLPDSKRSGILERLEAKGYEVPKFVVGKGSDYGMTYDAEGNQVELVFAKDGRAEDRYNQFQIGLSVSNSKAMHEFLSNILGLKMISEFTTGDGIHVEYFGVGYSQVKFWEVPKELPAWVGGPFDRKGMNLVQFLVPDVDAVRALVLKNGGHIHTAPFALGKLATIMFVDGPDGILFEFAGPLLARLR